ncbi:hypothetical protein M404DRAFT_1005986 [Pisolithus tinctorius Marx 270]|uniref:Uncharacterized protein n=1 Tax=Pisolithus tinctorius Marx 270 TaxID=870435 RepID=A0A0C3N940_PISTI|nr:hypothetical protein M404DRAFT_1005986 [Pisolithus tinctorius Marx 270]
MVISGQAYFLRTCTGRARMETLVPIPYIGSKTTYVENWKVSWCKFRNEVENTNLLVGNRPASC